MPGIIQNLTYFLFIILYVLIIVEKHGINGRHLKRHNVYLRDKIIELQCYAKCDGSFKHFDNCLKECQQQLMKAPRRGYCPFNAIFKNMNVKLQGLSCLYNCSYDYDCPEVQKCCRSTCGSVCVEPWRVRDDNLLPPIPKIEEYTLIPSEQKVEINYTINSLQLNSTYYFHVESRHYVGRAWRPRKFGAWQYQPVDKIAELHDYNSKLFSTKIGFNLRPVHWYQVRVAAINAYGFRGYSEPSSGFTLPNHPKPPKAPADLKIVSSQFDGTYYTVKIVWCTSKSNLPIEKYKIIWALYVKTKMKEESFISNETYVKERHQYEISNLLPDSNYYIQVQALSINGRKRLKSEPRSIICNTTNLRPTRNYTPLKCSKEIQQFARGLNKKIISPSSASLLLSSSKKRNHHRMEDINMIIRPNISTYQMSSTIKQHDLKFCLNRHNDLIVFISGYTTRRGKIYELCPEESNCEEYNVIKAKRGPLVFNKLACNTTYALRPLFAELSGHKMKSITFTTPPHDMCKRFAPC